MSRRTMRVALLLLVPIFGAQPTEKITPTARDLETMQGLWHALFIRDKDRANPAAGYDIKVLVKGDMMTFSPYRPGEMMKGRITLDPSRTPAELTLDVVDGRFKGQRLLFAYEFQRDPMNFKFRLAGYEGLRGMRERPRDVMPPADAEFTTLELVWAERIHADVMEKAHRQPDEPDVMREANITLLKYLQAIQRRRLHEMAELVAVPFYREGTLLKARAVVDAAQQEIQRSFGNVSKGVPAIFDLNTYGDARDMFSAEVRIALDGLLTKQDLVVEIHEPRGTQPPARNLLLIHSNGPKGALRIVGVMAGSVVKCP